MENERRVAEGSFFRRFNISSRRIVAEKWLGRVVGRNVITIEKLQHYRQ